MLRRRNGHGRRKIVLTVAERIRQRTSSSVARVSARGPEAVQKRLTELDRELDIDEASALIFLGAGVVGLGLGLRRRTGWLAISGAAASLLARLIWTGASPARSMLRNLGYRTRGEIREERETLRAGG